jgi:hypothetical protein
MTPRKGKTPMQIQESLPRLVTVPKQDKVMADYLPESPSVIDEVIEMAELALRNAWKRASGQG